MQNTAKQQEQKSLPEDNRAVCLKTIYQWHSQKRLSSRQETEPT